MGCNMLDGKRIIELRNEFIISKSMSQSELARRSGVSRITICNMELDNDMNHKIGNIKKVADVFGVDVKELLK